LLTAATMLPALAPARREASRDPEKIADPPAVLELSR
jgi:hypothetical protein